MDNNQHTKLILNALRITVTDTELEMIIKAYELAKAKGENVTLTDIKGLK